MPPYLLSSKKHCKYGKTGNEVSFHNRDFRYVFTVHAAILLLFVHTQFTTGTYLLGRQGEAPAMKKFAWFIPQRNS